ncbi:MAG TPA: STAS domain-containing protein [Rhodocyclaceae bacterium]|nr:STAS domain-containing protein [Rhodocyclaceae bacterium]
MVIPFFGKKPPDDKANAGTRADGGAKDKSDLTTTTMDFTQVGDMGRALSAAAGKIQVTEATHEDNAAAVEEAAILYANANNGGARAVLEAAIDEAGGKASETLWNMLFDLYRLTGERQAFDARGMTFAQQFEMSPPVWDQATPAATAPRDASPAVNLSGTLSGNAKTQFDQLVRIGAKTGKLRIELSRLKGVDDAGGILMVDTLAALKRAKVKVALLGAKHALSFVEPKLKVGEKEGAHYWHLALALIQQSGEQEHFEQVALDYAITFEESPPSWEPPEVVGVADVGSLELKIEEPVRNDFVMEGTITGNQPDVVRELAVYASQRTSVEIDASGLKRLEFVSAGALFNQFAQFQTQGKLAVIRNPNAMVMALLRVMGIDQVAQIELKRK